jgi:hypothetical protein
MLNENQRDTLLAKGRLLFDSCSADNDYACVIGYLEHNLRLGGWRTEVVTEFIEWLQRQRQAENQHSAHAAAVLQRLQEKLT